MKAFVVCASFLVCAVKAEPSSTLVNAAIRAKWSSFKTQHQKSYEPSEEQKRLSTFLENSRMIEEHNARFHQGLESFEMGLNDMTDMTLDEVISTRMGLVMPSNAEEIVANLSLHEVPPSVAAPSVVDWRNEKCVQHVKNQGACGSCYAFSAIGALETAHCKKHNKQLHDLSEQYVVDCGGRGCSGGWMHDMFAYMKGHGGAPLQGDYHYTAKVGTCNQSKRKVVHVADVKRIGRGDENGLMHALSSVGTISIAYNAGTSAHSHYRGGILDVPGCGNTPAHAVLLVGYGSENGHNYWVLKNSWGAGWGEHGYFRMSRGKNMCGIADWASYPIAA